MNCVIIYIFVTPYLLEITIMVHEKILKNKDIDNASLACNINSMSKILILFCENWVLNLKVTLPNFQPSNYAGKLSYILLYENTNYLCDKL